MLQNFFKQSLVFFKNDKLTIAAFGLSLIAGALLLVVSFASRFYPLNSVEREIFSVRVWAVGLFVLYAFATYAVCFLQGWKVFKAFSVFIQSNLLMLIALAFMLRLNNQPISFFGINIFTGMIFLPITFLIFFVNLNLFHKQKPRLILIVPQVLLFFVQAFSLINFLVENKVSVLAFRDPLVEYVLNLPVYAWLFICAISVSVVSVFNLEIVKRTNKILAGFLFLILMFAGLFAVNSLSIDSYWYKTFLMLVFWDFLFNPLKVIFEERLDSKFFVKLGVSVFYHSLLMLLIVLWYFVGTNIITYA